MSSTLKLLAACRVWLVCANAVAGVFTFGLAFFIAFARGDPGFNFTLSQISPSFFDFFYPAFITFSCTSAGHAFLGMRWLRTWARECRRHKALAPVAPTAALIVGALPPRSQLGRLEVFYRHHAAVFVRLRMLVEIALQTFQAHKMSQLVATRWINEVMGIILVCNCWFSLLIHTFMRGQSSHLARVTRLVVDSLLDLTYCVFIPVSIFFPYYRDYTGGIANFPRIYYYKDAWYADAISEFRHILMSSWVDCVAKLFASVAMLYRMHVIDIAIRTADNHLRSRRRSSIAGKRASTVSIRLAQVLDLVMFSWGVIVSGLYIQAAIVVIHASNVDCLLEMQPWGSSKYSCAVLEVDCVSQRTLGDRYTIEAALGQADPFFVQVLILSHCPDLTVPPSIQQLENLITLKIYNSTISSWDEDAALRARFHPTLRMLLFPRVRMERIPAGLLAHDFPPTVWDIELPMGNLTTLPDEITTAWTGVILFVMEAVPHLSMIPEAVLRLPRLWMLTVDRNNIKWIRDDAFTTCSVSHVILDGNPLEEIPVSASKLVTLGVGNTRVSALPSSWTADPQVPRAPTYMRATATPLCQDLLTVPKWLVIDCKPPEPDKFGYPMEEEAQRRSRSINK